MPPPPLPPRHDQGERAALRAQWGDRVVFAEDLVCQEGWTPDLLFPFLGIGAEQEGEGKQEEEVVAPLSPPALVFGDEEAEAAPAPAPAPAAVASSAPASPWWW
jgi:hypothetical protein